ncbi:MAG: hypothetical protein RQ760_19970 [Sedimentisphaerales bacterium]|nr:hypothetical protein [Sedimentisphaerales bacterium]
MQLDVYALGNALVDIHVQVEDSLLTELGLEKGKRYVTERCRQKEILQKLLGFNSLKSAQKAGNCRQPREERRRTRCMAFRNWAAGQDFVEKLQTTNSGLSTPNT